MNKRQAADYLGVSTRAVERYASKGLLIVEHEAPNRAEYDDKSVRELKREMGKKAAEPKALVKRDTAPGRVNQSLVKMSGLLLPMIREGVTAAITAAQPPAPGVPLSEKLMLTLSEASQLSGLSRNLLLEAIHAKSRTKKLVAQKLGKGWKIKRADLESYIKKL